VLVGALLGFLPFNVYPARVFLGDCGAASIGFCLACLGVRSNAALSSGLAILVPVLVVGVPVVDTALAIARRTVRRVRQSGAGIFTADRDHIHHRLIATGLNHPRAVLVLYAIAATTAGVAIGSVFVTERNAALLLVTLVAAAFIGIGRLRYDEFAVLRGGALLQIYDAPVLRLSIFPVFVDIAFVVLSLWIAIGLKFDDWRVVTSRPLALNLLTVLTASAVLAFAVRGLYRGSWRQVGVEDLIRTTSAVAVAVSIGAVAAQLMVPSAAPLSLFGIYGMVLLLLVTGARSSFRLLLHLRQRDVLEGDAVLIYGAGAGGSLALRELLNNRDHRVRPVGFIDDDPRRTGRLLNGYPILGSIESLDRLLRTERARGVVFASSKIPPERVAKARAICARHDVRVLKFSASLSVVHQAELPRKVLVHAKLPAS
jgi:UDP-GlcNAc:undecaprenyl-phosphate GlcNAc-1-phosphate transferase